MCTTPIIHCYASLCWKTIAAVGYSRNIQDMYHILKHFVFLLPFHNKIHCGWFHHFSKVGELWLNFVRNVIGNVCFKCMITQKRGWFRNSPETKTTVMPIYSAFLFALWALGFCLTIFLSTAFAICDFLWTRVDYHSMADLCNNEGPISIIDD
jgi:hypothetical protein